MITAKILADSINPIEVRLTTFILTYPLFIHAEIMTHRAFSRNAGSSRAIPLKTMLDNVEQNHVVPVRWPAEQKGMQGGATIEGPEADLIGLHWESALYACIDKAEDMGGLGLHKSIANRILAPWSHITVIITSTERGLRNLFELRAHKDADDNFQVLAFRMLDEYIKSIPRKLFWGHWHIPYAKDPHAIYTGSAEDNDWIIKPAIGRIARVSYNRQDQDDPVANSKICDRLAEAGHWSPFEHVAQAQGGHKRSNFDSGYDAPCGWQQFRKLFATECRHNRRLEDIMADKPDWITL